MVLAQAPAPPASHGSDGDHNHAHAHSDTERLLGGNSGEWGVSGGNGLHSEVSEGAQSPPYPLWFRVLRYIYRISKATILCSPANFFLGVVPLAIVAAEFEWSPVAIFLLNFLAILPLAELLSWSTEQLAGSVGQTLGGLLNATFGNAVEMIVGITALRQEKFSIVQSSMIGSILSSILLILGSCFFTAGYKEKEVKFNVDLIGIMSSLMIVSAASLIIPSASYFADLSAKVLQSSDDYILKLSHIAAIILFTFYIVYLIFQLRTHAFIFSDPDAEEPEDPELDPWSASLVLIGATVGVSVCSDYLIDSVDGFVDQLGVSKTFIGMILVPIVGNAGEFVATIHQARKNKMNFAIKLIVESTLQIALFVTPFLVIVGWIIGKPMSLRFDTFQTTVLSMAVIVVNCLIRDGRSNYFEGFLLVSTYFIIAIAFYVHPDVTES
ncbi:hypothetical protein G7Y89_g12636 [Cudoniella acicularis]|uniref:Vacuolar calcium ion transporter n=1 Tax=Cudoniella acicularis TaxID=354080 RepID=A0A8H4VWS4_9HELO|nr:hypothetical protein G7Y89_g12636 [Cudoniella acicularis]